MVEGIVRFAAFLHWNSIECADQNKNTWTLEVREKRDF